MTDGDGTLTTLGESTRTMGEESTATEGPSRDISDMMEVEIHSFRRTIPRVTITLEKCMLHFVSLTDAFPRIHFIYIFSFSFEFSVLCI